MNRITTESFLGINDLNGLLRKVFSSSEEIHHGFAKVRFLSRNQMTKKQTLNTYVCPLCKVVITCSSKFICYIIKKGEDINGIKGKKRERTFYSKSSCRVTFSFCFARCKIPRCIILQYQNLLTLRHKL